MTTDEGLKLVIEKFDSQLHGVYRKYLRNDWKRILGSYTSLRWDFPTGGSFTVSFTYDIKLRADGDRYLWPRVSLSVSCGSTLDEAKDFITVLSMVHPLATSILRELEKHEFEP